MCKTAQGEESPSSSLFCWCLSTEEGNVNSYVFPNGLKSTPQRRLKWACKCRPVEHTSNCVMISQSFRLPKSSFRPSGGPSTDLQNPPYFPCTFFTLQQPVSSLRSTVLSQRCATGITAQPEDTAKISQSRVDKRWFFLKKVSKQNSRLREKAET